MASTVWRGYITFGLISVPVRLYRAARAERVSFRRMVRSGPARSTPEPEQEEVDEPPRPIRIVRGPQKEDETIAAEEPVISGPVQLQPLRQVSVLPTTARPVKAEEIVHGYEFEPDRYVAIDKEELKNLAPKTATEMAIDEFVHLAEIDPVFFETSYYVVPEQAGQKAYALLYRSMQNAGLVALAQFAMHNREHVVVIRPGKRGLIAHTMFYVNEVRSDEEYRADIAEVSAKELTLADTLIRSLSGPFDASKYRDTYREKVEALIASKVAGEATSEPQAPARSAPVVDIADALQRSLAALKKPPASAPESQPVKKKGRSAKSGS